jgi:hypothetical protein
LNTTCIISKSKSSIATIDWPSFIAIIKIVQNKKINWITNKWSNTTNALGKTHIWKSTHLQRNQKTIIQNESLGQTQCSM